MLFSLPRKSFPKLPSWPHSINSSRFSLHLLLWDVCPFSPTPQPYPHVYISLAKNHLSKFLSHSMFFTVWAHVVFYNYWFTFSSPHQILGLLNSLFALYSFLCLSLSTVPDMYNSYVKF